MKYSEQKFVGNKTLPAKAVLGRVLERWAGIPFNILERIGYYLFVRPSNALFAYLDKLSYRLEGTWLHTLLAHTLFPMVLIMTLVFGFKIAEQGVNLASLSALTMVLIIYGLFCAPMERLMPYSRQWNEGGNDLSVDLLMYYSSVIWNVVSKFVISGFIIVEFAKWLEPYGRDIWPVFLPATVQIFLFILLKDFVRYWYHRALHEVPFLWRWHAVHHSVTRLYWLNGLRVHPIEIFMQTLIYVIPLALLQPPAEIVLMSVFMSLSIGIFQHANIGVKLGFWEYIFSIGDNHRYHHYNTKGIGDSNYGGEFITWDIIFGTFHKPKGETPPLTIGMSAAPNYPQTMAGLMIAPFIADQTVFADGIENDSETDEDQVEVEQSALSDT